MLHLILKLGIIFKLGNILIIYRSKNIHNRMNDVYDRPKALLTLRIILKLEREKLYFSSYTTTIMRMTMIQTSSR